MRKKVEVCVVDAFTETPFTGNPAGVVLDAEGLSEVQMQSIARELRHSETAFVLNPTSRDHDLWIRYFSPAIEVPICGHATIAAHFARASEGIFSEGIVRQRSGIGVLPVEVERYDGKIQIAMTQGEPELGALITEPHRGELLGALGLAEGDVNGALPLQIVSTGHSKVLIPLHDKRKLNTLTPDNAALSRLSDAIGCNGYYPFVVDDSAGSSCVWGRMFAPRIGIPEDPVTGNAAGPLGAYLSHYLFRDIPGPDNLRNFTVIQGEAMGRPGSIHVEVTPAAGRPAKVRILGRAVLVLKGWMEL